MFGTLQRFALSSCGISLHSNTEYGGLVTFDKEIEKHLSPALTGSPARHIRGLTRDIIRSQVGRQAFAESLGIPIDSLAADALFGDPSEYPAGVTLEFERRLAAISATISNGDLPTAIIPLPSSAVKSERRRVVDNFASGEAGADRLDGAEGQPPRMSPWGEDDGTSNGGVLPPEAGDEAARTSIDSEESREFLKTVFGRFEAAYGSPRVGLVVIRRLIGALEAPTDLDVVGCMLAKPKSSLTSLASRSCRLQRRAPRRSRSFQTSRRSLQYLWGHSGELVGNRRRFPGLAQVLLLVEKASPQVALW